MYTIDDHPPASPPSSPLGTHRSINARNAGYDGLKLEDAKFAFSVIWETHTAMLAGQFRQEASRSLKSAPKA